MEEEAFDLLFNQVLQQGRGIDNMFNHLFSFFRRKSDFFQNSGNYY